MKEVQSDSKTIEFTPVDIDQFFGKDESAEAHIQTGIIVLTPKEHKMVNDLNQKLAVSAPERLEVFSKRLEDLQNLAASIAAFPSLLERATLTGGVRTPQALIESLISNTEDGDTTLQLPSKATLGRGFLVAKIHTFSSLSKLAKSAHVEKPLVQSFQDETVSMMFLLLAEDVYLNLIHDITIPKDFRRQLALSLLLLWEHRADQNISDISPVLQSVWMARRTLAPAFGTMMGTSELLLISIQLGDQWNKFIRAKLSDPGVSQSMEEFLFGLSYEQILRLRSILKTKGISAIGRDEVSTYLGQHIKTDVSLDYRDFFTQYSIRRDNARARQRLSLPGPHRTLEDYFIRFVMELNKEKQNNDVYAKTK